MSGGGEVRLHHGREKRGGGFNLGRSVSHGGRGAGGGCCGPCACHRVGERSVNHHPPLAASFQEVVVGGL